MFAADGREWDGPSLRNCSTYEQAPSAAFHRLAVLVRDWTQRYNLTRDGVQLRGAGIAHRGDPDGGAVPPIRATLHD